MKSIKSALGLLLILLLAGGAYFYWHRQALPDAPQHITGRVERSDIRRQVLANGTVQAAKIINVGAQISGEISALHVQLGDVVQAGQLLAEIDARSQINLRDSAAAALEASKAQLKAAEIRAQEAKKQWQRQQPLLKSGAISKETLASSESNYRSAAAALEQAQAELRRSQLHWEHSGLNLEYTQVRAPSHGTVVTVAVEVGDVVNANQASPLLLRLAQTETMSVEAEIAEADVNAVRVGMPVELRILGRPQEALPGQLKSIDPAPLAYSKNSGSADNAVYYYGKIDLDNADGLLRIGMGSNVSITVAEAKQVLSIPLSAVQAHDEVLLLENGELRPQKVELGLSDGLRVEVRAGLEEGDEIVLSRGDLARPAPNLRRR